jgi:predicted metalloprotease with PDZ domain
LAPRKPLVEAWLATDKAFKHWQAMTNRIALPLLALSLTLAAIPAAAQDKSAPVAVQLQDATPLPADTPWPGGTIDLKIDATDTRRAVYRVSQTIPLPADTRQLTLLYPEWLPGNHSPKGPINLVSDVRFLVDGKPVAWKRNPLDVYAFDLTLPAGAKAVTAQFVHTSPVTGSEGRVTMTQEMLNLQWEKMSFYPAGHYTRRIAVKPTVKVPGGWTVYTALDGQSRSGDTVTWKPVDYETLVDSPIFAGKYAQQWQIGDNVRLDVVADKPSELALAPQNLAAFKALIKEADALFGARHFDHYDMLLALTDRMGGIGLEHHRSAENQFEPDAFTKWDEMDWDHNVVSHELVHSWNGKFRRPADLWTPDYRTPMQGSLLWVYEGQTQFWGYVLSARSGMMPVQDVRDALAQTAAYYDTLPGRQWRPLIDTTNDPIINQRRPQSWTSWQRSEDYYSEGQLIWLEVDSKIRELTGGTRSINEFARAFFGINPGDQGVATYTFDDVVRTLNTVAPFDWATYLNERVNAVREHAPLDWIAAGGYRLVYRDTPSAYWTAREQARKVLDLTFSMGLVIGEGGAVRTVSWDSPPFNAGLTNGTTIVAVNGAAYSHDAMREAVRAAAGTRAPIRVLIKQGDHYREVSIDYHDGLRYPTLERVGTGPSNLDALLSPMN